MLNGSKLFLHLFVLLLTTFHPGHYHPARTAEIMKILKIFPFSVNSTSDDTWALPDSLAGTMDGGRFADEFRGPITGVKISDEDEERNGGGVRRPLG